MTPDQITQLRQLLEKARRAFWNDEGWTWYRVETTRVLPLIDQALALLPCPTCNGMGIMMRCVIRKEDGELMSQDPEPCPDCQQHSP